MNAIAVREATVHDVPVLARFLTERWGEIVVSRGRVHILAALPTLVAERDGEFLGCLRYHDDGPSLEIVALAVTVERQGIGTALMRAVLSRARRVWLITTNDNRPAQAFYEKLGLRLVTVYNGAVAESRRLKPSIPLLGIGGVPIVDELEYEWSNEQ
jgi:N-acetylglutamate synthase-like GNAT family acetyltransferase